MENLFDNKEKSEKNSCVKHLGYYVGYHVRQFFRSPYSRPKRELDVLDTIQTLLESEPTSDNISKCKDLSRLHRMVENTRARRRLEKWSLTVIAAYLVIVLSIVVASYSAIEGFHLMDIPDGIMITILSTTTVNIIGLGLIVLRGHFLANNDKEDNA